MPTTPSFTLAPSGPNRLQLAGTLNVYTACDLRDALADQIVPGASVEIDLCGVTACDLTGIQLLYATRKTAGEASLLRFAAVPTSIREACSAIGLEAGWLFASES